MFYGIVQVISHRWLFIFTFIHTTWSYIILHWQYMDSNPYSNPNWPIKCRNINVRVKQVWWTFIMVQKHTLSAQLQYVVELTVLGVWREAASDYLASTAAPAEWFTPHCSALVYCVQKIHQCEHQSATGTPLRMQSIHFHAAQPWPMLGCPQI